MKAILRVEIADWTDGSLPVIKKGSIITVKPLDNPTRIILFSDYTASVTVNSETIQFTIDKADFQPIN